MPAPVTTIAWRLAHVSVGVFGARNASHFGGPPLDYSTVEWPEGATGALAMLDDVYGGWVDGVKGLDDAGLARPCGPAEGPFADFSGTVEEILADKGKVKVKVSLFGRPTTVELDYLQLRGH